jgi:hypothetical protein
MTTEKEAIEAFVRWYNSLPYFPQNHGPAKGTIAGSLITLERLKEDYSLSIDKHTTERGTQIRGASGNAVAKILARFGETRQYVSEGGRTNRGLRSAVESLLNVLRELHLEKLPESNRNEILEKMQEYLVDEIRAFFNRQRLPFHFDPTKSVLQMLQNLLEAARESGKEGPVAQYLIGAKLAVRFPGEDIENFSYSTADVQTERSGDFSVRDTIFHVTVAPQTQLIEKCRKNLQNGYRVYILVPERVVLGARQLADQAVPGQITVMSIEGFTAQNIEEMACFSNNELKSRLHALLETYNKRVGEVEIDNSMLINIPANLQF